MRCAHVKLGNVCVNNKLSHFVYVECRFFSASKYSMAKGIISSRDFSYSLAQWTQVAWLKHFFTTWSLAAVLRRESFMWKDTTHFSLLLASRDPDNFWAVTRLKSVFLARWLIHFNYLYIRYIDYQPILQKLLETFDYNSQCYIHITSVLVFNTITYPTWIHSKF